MFKLIFLKQSDASVLGPEQTLDQSINMLTRKSASITGLQHMPELGMCSVASFVHAALALLLNC